MLKLLFNIFIVYAIWQLIKMFFVVKKVQTGFQKNMEDLNETVKNQSKQKKSSAPKKTIDTEGEYIDYEEIK